MSDGPQHPAIRASDTEREGTIALLRQAVADGRLTLDEFSDRVGLAQVARTDQDLPGPGAAGRSRDGDRDLQPVRHGHADRPRGGASQRGGRWRVAKGHPSA